MSVPKAMQEKYDIIAPMITDFCKEHLNEEYSDMSLLLLEKLCRKRPSPLVSGWANTWACAIVYTIGANNFLFDRSDPLYIPTIEMAEIFGVSKSTASNKATEIRRMLKIKTFDPNWTIPSKLEDNPFVWMFETSTGFLFDARYSPYEVRQALFEAGMIPFIPEDRESIEIRRKKKKEESQKANNQKKKEETPPLEGQFSLDDGLPSDE